MPKYTRPTKMTDAQRRSRYRRRKALSVALAVLVAAAFVLADRLGVFGRKSPGDFEKYHDKTFRVVEIMDGDTLEVGIPDGHYEHTRVRLLGVDTPEVAKEDTPAQHFAREAATFTTDAALGETVRLELLRERTRGKYGRLLAYVYLPGGRMLNRVLVTEGYGYADRRFEHPRKSEFAKLQKQAMRGARGLWKDVGPEDLPYYYRNLKLPEERGR